MRFELKLQVPSVLGPLEATSAQYDPELDNVISILSDICDALAVAGVRFTVRVCSDEYWPTTVRTDLLVVIEQLNDTLNALDCRRATRLDFYEQGVERIVSFYPKNGTISVGCSDMMPTDASQVDSAILPRDLVINELSRLAEDVLRVSRAYCPQLTSHPWFEEWAIVDGHSDP